MRPEFSLFVYRKSTVNVEHILQFLKHLALCDYGLWMTLCFKSKINKKKKTHPVLPCTRGQQLTQHQEMKLCSKAIFIILGYYFACFLKL